MNPIQSPLSPPDTGVGVAALQDALLFLFDKGRIRGPDAQQKELVAALRRDRETQAYGEGTIVAVRVFREQFVSPGEIVDEPTAEALNKLLKELGALDAPDAEWIVRGQVVDAGGPVNGVQVSVFDRDLFFRRDGNTTGQLLGTEITANGSTRHGGGWFEATYKLSDFAAGDIPTAGDAGEAIPDLIFALSRDAQPIGEFRVYRLPGEGFPDETLVSDDDLILGFQGRRLEEVRIVIPGGELRPEISEYERVWRALEPLLPESAPEGASAAQREARVCAAATRFDEEKHRDVSFAARETRLDRSLIHKFANACRLALDPFQNVPGPSAFYALARLRGVSDLLTLGRLSTDDLRLALEQAATAAPALIPPFKPASRLKEAVRLIREGLASHLPSYRAMETDTSLADLLGADLPDAEEQGTLWRVHSDHVGTPEEFWKKLQTQPGFKDPQKIAKVKYRFQLGLLAQDNVPLVEAVRDLHPKVTHTGELAFLLDTKEKWTALLDQAGIAAPADVPGLPEERQANYAASLAGALQIAHPTAAVANLVASLPGTHLAKAQPAVARFLTDAVRHAKFDLATGAIDGLVAEHGDQLLAEVEPEERERVIGQVKRVQRLFRLSSGPESLKVLLDAGFHSARELAELPSEVAMDMLKPAMSETAARLMLNRATSISAEAIQKLVFANDEVNGLVPATLRGFQVAKETADTAPRRGPDYASLFGSVELCDCQDCRSIHGPAAYLVALLEFLGPEALANTPLITPRDVLLGNPDKKIVGRRPDIAHLQLSCENTNTALPYVDLVNEVLESYIVFSQTLPLKTDEAGVVVVPPVPQPNESSPAVSAAELSANPENTRDLAYEELEAAVYPFSLPFHQPFAALRLTLERMGSSRHELMAVFRRDGSEAFSRALDAESLKFTEREFGILTGEQFDATPIARPVSDFYGFERPVAPSDTAWVANALPVGATPHVDKDTWAFAAFAPPPPSGATTHVSALAAGLHQHYFDKTPEAAQLKLESEDLLFAEVFLDPDNLPDEVMLQWFDGSWEHRAYWGQGKIGSGVEGTASRRYMGPLPAAGEWVRLEVPVYFVGLAGRALSGAAFTLFGGAATWGASGKRSASWVEQVTHVPTLLTRAGISYVELIDLLRTQYVNPSLPQSAALAAFERIPVSYGALARLVANGFADVAAQLKTLRDPGMTGDELKAWAAEHFDPLGKLLVMDAPDSSCDLTLTRLQHLDGTLLDDTDLSRLHRFIRLWKKTGWTPRDLDRALLALQETELTPALLRELGQIAELQTVLKLPMQALLSFWGAIPTTGEDALYHKLFLNKAVREIDADFAAADGDYLPLAAGLKLQEHLPALLAGLRVRDADLTLILKHTELDDADAPLTLATVTTLYRYVTLARALKKSVQDLIALEILSGERPFSTLAASKADFADIEPARTLRFVKLVEHVAQSGFTAANLGYLFNELTRAPLALAPQAESLQLLLTTIREGLIGIAAESVPADDPIGEMTRAKLGLLFEAHTVESVTAVIAGTQTFLAPMATKPAALRKGRVTYDEPTRLLRVTGWLTLAERDALLTKPDSGGFHAAVHSLFQQPRDVLEQTLAKQLGWTTVEADLETSVLERTSLAPDGSVDPALVATKFNAFLAVAMPHLRATLGRALVKQTVANALLLEPSVAALLLEGTGQAVLLGSAADRAVPAMADFLALPGDGLQATYFENEAFSPPARETRVDAGIDFHWEAKHRFSVRWEGGLLPDKTQRYQLHLRVGGGARLSVDGEVVLDRPKDAAPAEYTAAVDLQAGKLHALKLEYTNRAADALIELRWSSAGTPAQIVPSYRLYSRGNVATAAEHTFIRLHKVSLLVNGFKLTARELGYLADRRRADALNLNELPIDAAPADQHALFAAWAGWNDYARLRGLALRDPTAVLDALRAPTATEAQLAWVQAAGCDESTLAAVVGTEGFALTDAAFSDSVTLLKVAEAMRLLGVLGAPAAEVFRWAAAAPSMAEARAFAQEAKRAHKSQYDNEAWLEIARSISDPLRESQRAALVAYLMPRLGFTDTGQLFGHFLIDVEMGACMRTSRIKQAISSVQLFVQRYRMNLEPAAAPKMIDERCWAWMQNYRVWEANRKVFLYPENWIEPELRDDKSPFFRELESELLQGEVTSENAEIALGNYLEKLETVSQLKICGLLEEDPDENGGTVLHVFGHTFATPRVFFYRKRITVNPNYRYWTAWEKVPLDIEADEVLPVIWNRRLYLFWVVASSNVEKDGNGNPTRNADSQRKLAWAEYRRSRWSAKRITEKAFSIRDSTTRMDAELSDDELSIVLATPSKGVGSSARSPIDPSGSVELHATFRRQGSMTFLNHGGLATPATGTGKATSVSEGFFPVTTSTIHKFMPVAGGDLFPVFGSGASTGEIELFGRGYLPYSLNTPHFLQNAGRTYLVLPHTFDLPVYNGTINADVAYVPGGTFVQKALATTTAAAPIAGQLAQLGVALNPWLASRAEIMAAETRTPASAILGDETVAPKNLSLESQLFDHGVLHPKHKIPRAYPAEFRFETFFHPYAVEFQKRLNRYGVPGLLNVDSQRTLDGQHPRGLPKLMSFAEAYAPEPSVRKPWPEHDVDFEFPGAYSLYNWEMFLHVPLFLAARLSQEQRFEEAMRWLQFIFDPTIAETPTDPAPRCYWNILPFRNAEVLRLDDMLKKMRDGNANLVAQWQDLQVHPFKPHRVARMRLVAYQKTVVMKYIDNLVAWGDQLFRRETIESINQATQLYVMAAELLGPLPERVPQRGRSQAKTYDQLRKAGLDQLGQAVDSFENDLPFSSRATAGETQTEAIGLTGIGRTSYFCIPKNDKLLGYWDTVADRLFKIRHCMNIEGGVRDLPLFEAPIDPGLLVRAAAAGVDLNSVLNDMSAPQPFYRFSTILGKSLELTAELRSLGSALLSALEKRDAEHLAALRSTHETELLSLVKRVKQQQVDEATANEEALRKGREGTQLRYDFYSTIPQRIAEEENQLAKLKTSEAIQAVAESVECLASDVTKHLVDISAGVSFPIPTELPVTVSLSTSVGRANLIAHFQAKSREIAFQASKHAHQANESSILGGWKRRADDWKLQADLALKELAQIDKQIVAAGIRVAIAEKELANTTRQIEQSQEVEEFLRTKFTNEELCNWTVGNISAVFFQCYQMAYDLAKKAERCFRFELGLTTSNFIQFGAWDSQRKGLLSGERLLLQLKQMERAYLDGNRREYELTKHYSLVLNDPLALIQLKAQGKCDIELPEALFDADFPGHYMRRLKSVWVTIPAVVGPYAGVNSTLTLLRDKTRVKSTPADSYGEREGQEDDRFVTNWSRAQAIATSSGQNDSGMFERNLRDERYLPFEGAGAVSLFRLELDPDSNGFDVNTLSDVVLHLDYTARDGREPLKKAAKEALAKAIGAEAVKPQTRLFSLKHEFPTEWHQFTRAGGEGAGNAVGTFSLNQERFPFLFRSKTLMVGEAHLYAVLKDGAANPVPPLAVRLKSPAADNAETVEFGPKAKRGIFAPKNALDVRTEIKSNAADAQWILETDRRSLQNVDDLLLVCEYAVGS